MTVRFYMDEHVHGHITDGLRQRGVDVLTIQDEGREGHTDEEVLERATQLGRVVFTRDQDFHVIAADWVERGRPFAGVVYTHLHTLSIGDCIRELEMMAKCSDADEWRDKLTFLPL